MIQSPTATHRAAFSRALDLYDELYVTLRDHAESQAELVVLDALYARGASAIQALRDSAGDVPLSDEADGLLDVYLSGPGPEDVEAQRAWMTMLPDLLVQVRRAEEDERVTAPIELDWVVAAAGSIHQEFSGVQWRDTWLRLPDAHADLREWADFVVSTDVFLSTAEMTWRPAPDESAEEKEPRRQRRLQYAEAA